MGVTLDPSSPQYQTYQELVKSIALKDSLYTLSETDKTALWSVRSSLINQSVMLPFFLRSVNWFNKAHRHEAHRLLKLWSSPLSPTDCLQLLDVKMADYKVRQYGVQCLERMQAEELAVYVLQLTQCLKFEPYHSSPLARFLIDRALRAPYVVGQALFWNLKAEMGAAPEFTERFSVILEEYLSYCGPVSVELRKQHSVVVQLQRVAETIVSLKAKGKEGEQGDKGGKLSDDQIMLEYHQALEMCNKDFFGRLPGGKFQIPYNSSLEAKMLKVEKCRYMSSKKKPLWLVFTNADPEGDDIIIIFKSGDDLRQDMLTLQLLSIMQELWLDAGYDMRLSPYRCIATGVNAEGEGVGMIEVVRSSDTTSNIQKSYGGGAKGAFKLEVLDQFIREHNNTEAKVEKGISNFMRSCAGYCVATYVLGIGDRHNDNIMVKQDGHLFHIDFGHFLGNFKSKMGVKRERAAFVFTPQMAFVMGGKNFKSSDSIKAFKDLCFQAYNTIRRHASLIENLFVLMVAAGMPELSCEDDISYLQDMMSLDLSDQEAAVRFDEEITNSVTATSRVLDNYIHNLVH